MPRLRQARTKEEAAEVPKEQSIQIVLNDDNEPHVEPTEPEKKVEVKQEVKKDVGQIDANMAENQEVLTPPKESDDVLALKKQIEAYKQAEKSQRDALAAEQKRAEEAIRRETELRAENLQSQYDTIVNAIEAAKYEAEAAQGELEKANINGDTKAQVDAIRRMSRAEANIAKLEDGKLAYETKFQQEKDRPKNTDNGGVPTDPFERAIHGLPQNVQSWLRSHPEYMTNSRLNISMQKAHFDVEDEGHAFGSPAYMEAMEVHLGLRQKPKAGATVDNDRGNEGDSQPITRQVVTQAPPSRESVSTSTGKPSSTKVTLTPAQREAAKFSNIDEVTYAKEVQKYQELKRDGLYGEGR